MKNNRYLFVALLIMLLAPARAPAQQALEHDEVTQHHAPLSPGKRVVIRHSYGAVRLHTGEKPEVSVRVERHLIGMTRQAIQSYLRALKISVQALDDRVEIRSDRPAGDYKLLTQTTVDLDVTLPKDVPVEVTNSFGDLEAQGIGSLRATAPFGDLTVRNITGDVTLGGQYGKVVVSDVQGDVTITHSFGDVDVTRVGGSLSVNNQFAQIRAQGIGRRANIASRSGPITLTNVGGGAQVSCQRGQVEINRVEGDLSVTNRDESVSVAAVQGVVVIQNSNGLVRARQITGELKIDNRYWTVEIERVVGKVTVQHGNGAVQARDVRGDVVISTNNGPIRVQQIRGAAVLANSHGLIEIDGVSGDCNVRNEFASVAVQNLAGGLEVFNAWGMVQADLLPAPARKEAPPWVIQTSHSNVILGVPARVGCSLSVDVNSGSIGSQFPLKVQRAGGKESAQAAINGGGVKVDIRVDLGMAQIQRRLAPPVHPVKK